MGWRPRETGEVPILSYPTTENQRGAQAVQFQLMTFSNIEVDVETGENATTRANGVR
jgi:hypothetical protein